MASPTSSTSPSSDGIDHFLDKSYGQPGFTADVEPALRIKPGTGARIGFETNDEVYAQLHEHKDMAKLTAQLNPVTGPLYVEGAQPGDALAVTIHEIRLKNYGWSVSLPGVGALRERMGPDMFTRQIPIDGDGVHIKDGLALEPAPMIGCIGTAPAQGSHSTIMPSYAQGGNMDLTDCRPGTTVYLPVMTDGAYLSIGDIHAIMAEGESSFVAIEAEGVAVISVDIVKNLSLRAPRIETKSEWIFVGLGDPVQDSVQRGYEDAFDFLINTHAFTPGDAYALLSAVCHSRLGGPTGSTAPDPLHPMAPIGAVTTHHLPKNVLTP